MIEQTNFVRSYVFLLDHMIGDRPYKWPCSMIIDFYVHHIRHRVAKFEDSSYISSKLSVFLKDTHYPVKTKITSTKINIFLRTLDSGWFMNLSIDLYQTIEKYEKFFFFFDLPNSPTHKKKFWEISGRKFILGHNFQRMLYRVTRCHGPASSLGGS